MECATPRRADEHKRRTISTSAFCPCLASCNCWRIPGLSRAKRRPRLKHIQVPADEDSFFAHAECWPSAVYGPTSSVCQSADNCYFSIWLFSVSALLDSLTPMAHHKWKSACRVQCTHIIRVDELEKILWNNSLILTSIAFYSSTDVITTLLAAVNGTRLFSVYLVYYLVVSRIPLRHYFHWQTRPRRTLLLRSLGGKHRTWCINDLWILCERWHKKGGIITSRRVSACSIKREQWLFSPAALGLVRIRKSRTKRVLTQ